MTIMCDCGHGIDEHFSINCTHPQCTCEISKDAVEARYWANKAISECKTLRAQLAIAKEAMDTAENLYPDLSKLFDKALQQLGEG